MMLYQVASRSEVNLLALLINVFVIFLCGNTRLNRITGWLCIIMGVGASDGRRYSESTWHFCQSDSRTILSARQQIRRS